jgi:hypothetical protein
MLESRLNCSCPFSSCRYVMIIIKKGKAGLWSRNSPSPARSASTVRHCDPTCIQDAIHCTPQDFSGLYRPLRILPRGLQGNQERPEVLGGKSQDWLCTKGASEGVGTCLEIGEDSSADTPTRPANRKRRSSRSQWDCARGAAGEASYTPRECESKG